MTGLGRRQRESYAYRQARKAMFAIFGTLCHICQHDGAGEADHLDPLAISPGQPIDPLRMRPAHGTSAPCPVCKDAKGEPRKCNQERGAKPVAGPLTTSRDW